VFGEVGLTGEIRPAPRGQERLREAGKLGFSRVLLPRANLPKRGATVGSLAGARLDGSADAPLAKAK
jgi:DNA repair protein RadA/Sms